MLSQIAVELGGVAVSSSDAPSQALAAAEEAETIAKSNPGTASRIGLILSGATLLAYAGVHAVTDWYSLENSTSQQKAAQWATDAPGILSFAGAGSCMYLFWLYKCV